MMHQWRPLVLCNGCLLYQLYHDVLTAAEIFVLTYLLTAQSATMVKRQFTIIETSIYQSASLSRFQMCLFSIHDNFPMK
jgi:hypothetical protein